MVATLNEHLPAPAASSRAGGPKELCPLQVLGEALPPVGQHLFMMEPLETKVGGAKLHHPPCFLPGAHLCERSFIETTVGAWLCTFLPHMPACAVLVQQVGLHLCVHRLARKLSAARCSRFTPPS